MQRILSLLVSMLVAGLLVACDGGNPEIAAEIDRLDLGDVPNGEIVARDVVVTNEGDAMLVIEELSTSCGCTTATLVPMQLAPGERGALHIEFDSGAHGPDLTGPLVRQVFIRSNDPAQPEVSIELAVNVTPPLQAGEN